MNNKINYLIKFLTNNDLSSYAGKVESLIKIAADLSLNQKTFNLIYSEIKKNSEEYQFLEDEEKLEFFSGQNKEKLDSVIKKVYNIIFSNIDQEEKYFPVFSNKRGDQLACINWCVVQAIEEYNLDVSDEDLLDLVSIFATISTNKSNMYYHAEKDDLKVITEISPKLKKAEAKKLKAEGYKPLSSSSDFNERGVYYRGPSLYNKFFDSNDIENYKDKREEKIENKKIFKSGSEEIYRDEDFSVIFLKTQEACHVGYFESTSWCITMDDSHYWDEYAVADNLHFYVIEKHSEKNKKEPMRKMAIPFSFEEVFEEQLRDKDDKLINLKQIKKYLGEKYEPIFGALNSHRKSIPVITDQLAEAINIPKDSFRSLEQEEFLKIFDRVYKEIVASPKKSDSNKKEFYFNYIKRNHKKFSDESFAKYVSLVLKNGFLLPGETEKIGVLIENDGSNLSRIIKSQNKAIKDFGRDGVDHDIMIFIADNLSDQIKKGNSKIVEEIFEDKDHIDFVEKTLLDVAIQVSRKNSMYYETYNLIKQKSGSPIFFLKMTKYLGDEAFLKNLYSKLIKNMKEDKAIDFFFDLKEVCRSLESYEKLGNPEDEIQEFVDFIREE